jgi:hypothetical protein
MNSNQFKLEIKKPCQQSWDAMLELEGGRYCQSCKKVVTDFTNLSDQAIGDYLIANANQENCGRFKQEQIHRIRITIPTYIFEKRLPKWKYFLVATMICFGTNLFPIDFVIGNHSNVYAQTTKTAAKQKKKKGLKLKRYKIISTSDHSSKPFVFDMVSGGFSVTPIVNLTEVEIQFSASCEANSNDSNSISINNDLAKKETPQKNNDPEQQASFFILTETEEEKKKKKVKTTL